MAVIRGQSYRVGFVAWDLANNAPKTGDTANITVRIRKDGGALTAATNNPVEVDATNAPGLYEIELTASEMDANTIQVVPKSTTANTYCQAVTILTERGRVDTPVSSRATAGDVWGHSSRTLTGNVTVGSYASGQNPADYVLATPANKLATDSSGRVTVGSNADKSGYALASGEYSNIASAVWSAGTRTLTSFGSLVSDIWGHSSRTLTSFGTLVNDVANAVWSYTVEASQSAVAWLRLMGAALFGKRTVSGSTYTHRDWADTKNRIVGSVDNDGNRSITTRDGS
jgi:hypothetical protein